MKKLTQVFGFMILATLSACNAFKQKVNVGPGSERIEDHTFEILLMLGVAFALGLWLGWILWNKYKLMVEGLQMENQSLTAAINSMRAELDATKTKLATAENGWAEANQKVDHLSSENERYHVQVMENEADLDDLMGQYRDLNTKLGLAMASSPESKEIPMEITTSPMDVFVEDLAEGIEPAGTDVPPAVEVLAETIGEPDLEIDLPEMELTSVDLPEDELPTIEMPVILATAFVSQTEDLTKTETEEVTETVVISIPEPTQTEILATETKTDEPEAEKTEEETHVVETVILEGPEPTVAVEAPQETVEIPAEVAVAIEPGPLPVAEETIPLMTFSDAAAPLLAPKPVSEKRDDLKVVEGLGPKIEELMFRNGIYTFTQLAATPVNRLKEMLVAEGPNYGMHDPGTWPAQSLLAANSEWENLRAYQSFLNAGKRPN